MIDSFVATGANEPVFVMWPEVQLDPAQRAGPICHLEEHALSGAGPNPWVEASLVSGPPGTQFLRSGVGGTTPG